MSRILEDHVHVTDCCINADAKYLVKNTFTVQQLSLCISSAIQLAHNNKKIQQQ